MTTITHATSYFDGDISHGFGVELTTYSSEGRVLGIEWLPAEGVSVIEPIDWTADYAEELLRQSGWRCTSGWESITDPRDGAPGCHAVVAKAQAAEAAAAGR